MMKGYKLMKIEQLYGRNVGRRGGWEEMLELWGRFVFALNTPKSALIYIMDIQAILAL